MYSHSSYLQRKVRVVTLVAERTLTPEVFCTLLLYCVIILVNVCHHSCHGRYCVLFHGGDGFGCPVQ